MKLLVLIKQAFTLLVALGLLGACATSNKNGEEHPPKGLTFPTPPATLTEVSERAGYVITHVFDDIERIDTALFADSNAREQFLVDLFGIGTEASEEARRVSMRRYFQLATPQMDSLAVALIGKYFGDPNSPLYDEGNYLLLQEEAKNAGLLDYGDQLRLSYRKALFMRNRVGDLATDFKITLPNGKQSSLYQSATGQLNLLIFYNPGCGTCEKIIEYMAESPLMRDAVARGLKVIFIYPFADERAWHEGLPHIPTYATVGMDKAGKLVEDSLYDLKAMPTLYLLDGAKRVLLKDAFMGDIEIYIKENWLNK